jgi:hypothetical protein
MDDVTGRDLAVGLSIGVAMSKVTLPGDRPSSVAVPADWPLPENALMRRGVA